MSEKNELDVNTIDVIDAIELPTTELNDFNELVDDFMSKGGYSESEAEVAAINVLNQDRL